MMRAWAARWNIPQGALDELAALTGIDGQLKETREPGASESRIQSQCRLRAEEQGNFLTRNNVGALKDERGVPVRYGLMNDSKALNKVIKSADLIGGRRVLITGDMVGQTILQFYSVECKEADWKFNPNDPHTEAQLRWAQYINSRGGYAVFATTPDHI